MVTRAGLRKSASSSRRPRTVKLEGIGKSRVSWGKISNVTVGVDAYMVRFKDIVVKEDAEGLEDGILGALLPRELRRRDPVRGDDARARKSRRTSAAKRARSQQEIPR